MKNVYLFVEGNTDKALVETLLQKYYQFMEYKNKNDMPVLLSRQLTIYPQTDGSLENKSRPSFLYKDNICIMLEVVGGKSHFAERISGRLMTASLESFPKDDELDIVLIQDRDLDTDEEKRNELNNNLRDNGIIWEKEKISYDGETFSFFECCLPFNRNGAVETLILEIAEKIHPDLWEESGNYRKRICDEKFARYRDDWAKTEIHQNLYADKLQVGAITAVLKPDSSPAMMIKDKLIKKNNLEDIRNNEEIQKLLEFFDRILR